MMTTLTLIRCVLCQGTLPGVQDEVFLAHMRDHHRTFHNMDFMFAASFLTEENIEHTVDLMRMNNNNENLDDNESLVDVKETKYELLESKDTFNIHESDNENTQTLGNNDTTEITKMPMMILMAEACTSSSMTNMRQQLYPLLLSWKYFILSYSLNILWPSTQLPPHIIGGYVK